ncbi:hypothetical protein PtB15_7B271 [Puccinia triticina]|nr:hypothetical protein PtB15_7B271 [Puccinia triticina]
MYLLDTFGFDFQPGYNYEPCGPSVLRKLSRTSGGPETKKTCPIPADAECADVPQDGSGQSPAGVLEQPRQPLHLQPAAHPPHRLPFVAHRSIRVMVSARDIHVDLQKCLRIQSKLKRAVTTAK